MEIIHNEQRSFASLHAHRAHGASRCSLIPGATSTRQHAPPVIAHLSLCLHALTLSLCSQTQHISSVSVVQAGNAALSSAGLTTHMSHHPCFYQEGGFLHHRASIPHWIPSAPTVFMSEKKLYFWLSVITTCCRMTYASSEEGFTSLHKSQKCPPSSSQIADAALGKTRLCSSLARLLDSTRKKKSWPWTAGHRGDRGR